MLINNEWAHDYTEENANIEYSFSYSFKKANAGALGIQLDEIDAQTRHPDVKITLAQNEPAQKKNQLRNFDIIAEVRDTNLPANDKKYKKRALLRIHIHKLIKEFWLSPGALNIYKNDGGYLSPRVLFDDGCVAELNLSVNKKYHILPTIKISYTTSSAEVIASADGRIFEAELPWHLPMLRQH